MYFKYILNLEIIHLASSKILKQSAQRTIQFSVLVENFPSFIISKAEYKSVSINFNNTEWFVKIELHKYCQTSKENSRVTPSSPDPPETLAALLCGRRRSDPKECSFIVDATFKFKQSDTVQQGRYFHRFCFDSTKDYYDWGY